jgi:hypothetical protein
MDDRQSRSRLQGHAAAPVPAAGDYWAARADELAEWTWTRLVNRTDVWGGYLQTWDAAAGRWVTRPTTRPGLANRGQVLLIPAVLVRHFGARRTRHVAGLHTTSPANTCRWGALDLDRHGDAGPAPATTRAAALHWFGRLCALGFHPLLTESDGKGGYHLHVVFSEPVPAARMFSFLCWLVTDYATIGLPGPPETYPKQPAVAPPGQAGQYGSWMRLAGRHHTRAYWGRVWDGDEWLGGNQAIDHILSIRGDDPGLIPTAAVAVPAPAGGRPTPGRAPPVLPDLIGTKRNIHLTSLAGTNRRRGLRAEEILPLLLAVNSRRCRPPLDAEEIEGIAYGMERYAPAEVPLSVLYPGRTAHHPKKILHCEFEV